MPETAETEVERMKKEIEEEVSTPGPDADAPKKGPDPKAERDYTFQFDWTDARGKVWAGAFTDRILSIRDRQRVGVMRSKLAAGLPADSIDTLTAEINLIVAHMTFSLVSFPDWAKDLTALTDVELLQQIYMEVAAHEAKFLGRGEDSEGSAK